MNRISFGQVFSQAQANIGRNFQRLFAAQLQLTTGKRIIHPSDGAAETGRLFGLIREDQGLSRFQETLDTGISQVDAASQALLSLSDMVQRARELAVQAANGTLNSGDRQSIGAEFRELVSSIIDAANSQVDGHFAFAGTEVQTPPFTLVSGADGLSRVVYGGNRQIQKIEISPGIFSNLNIPGNTVFGAGPLDGVSFEGQTGAQPGSGTPSGSGRARLLLTHLATAFGDSPTSSGADPATGLAPGSSSAELDSVLGSGHSVTITSDASGNGTISLDGGPTVPFTSTDSNLKLTGPAGEIIFVDTSSITPSLNAAVVSMSAQGSLSLDGGQSSVPIDFTSTNQQVQNQQTGAVLSVNSTNIRQTGTEQVSFDGAYTLFDDLLAIRDVLLDTKLDNATASGKIRARLSELDRGHSDLLNAAGELGARHSRFQSTKNRLEDLNITVKDLRSRIEDADLANVTLDVNRFQTLYQASLQISARINQLSLLNFI